MILVTLHYTVPLDQIDTFLEPHRALLNDLAARGIIICSGPKNPRTGGVILMNIDSINAAQHILSADPFMQHNLATYDYTEFTPVKCAPEFKVFLK
jgi:uncharacterized protein YciI